jgi:PAS domain S-box-containing protein
MVRRHKAGRGKGKRQVHERKVGKPIEELPFAACVLSETGTVLACNGHATTLSGWRAEELIGKVLPARDLEPIASVLRQPVFVGSEPKQMLIQLRSSDGLLLPVLLCLSPLPVQANEPKITCALMLRLPHEGAPLVQVSQRRFHTVTRVIGPLLHDLGNVLGPLAGWAAGLQREVAPDRQTAPRSDTPPTYVSRAAGQIEACVAETLDFLTTMRTARRVSARQRRPLVLDEAIRAILRSDSAHSVKLSLQVPNAVVGLLAGDLRELIAHALLVSSHANPSETITIGTRKLASHPSLVDTSGLGYVTIEFSSSAPLPPTASTREALRQLAADQWIEPPDLALSAAAVRTIAEDNGGFATISTGQGPSLMIVLPRATMSVLVVDDNAGLLAWLEREFHQMEWLFLGAPRAEDAQRIIDDASIPVDCLMTDVMLPDGNGVHIALALMKKREGTRIVIMSGMILQAEEAAIAARIGAVVLYKPFLASDVRILLSVMGSR